jgi:hypothetical protein
MSRCGETKREKEFWQMKKMAEGWRERQEADMARLEREAQERKELERKISEMVPGQCPVCHHQWRGEIEYLLKKGDTQAVAQFAENGGLPWYSVDFHRANCPDIDITTAPAPESAPESEQCGVCDHPDLAVINAKLRAGSSLLAIAQLYFVGTGNEGIVKRHRDQHLGRGIVGVPDAAAPVTGPDSWDGLIREMSGILGAVEHEDIPRAGVPVPTPDLGADGRIDHSLYVARTLPSYRLPQR